MVLPLLLPALIGGAITGIGGALKASAQQRAQDQYLAEYAVYKENVENTPQVTTHDTKRTGNLAGLVAASEAAGFNPVTVLRAGGLAYFSDDYTTITAPKLWVPPAPREGFSPIGEFAQGFGQSVSSIDLSAMQANMAQAALATAQVGLTHAQTGLTHIQAQAAGQRVKAGPVLRGPGAGPNGEVLNMWTKWHNNRTGQDVWTVNPDLPDIEQLLVPAASQADADLNRLAKQAPVTVGDVWRYLTTGGQPVAPNTVLQPPALAPPPSRFIPPEAWRSAPATSQPRLGW